MMSMCIVSIQSFKQIFLSVFEESWTFTESYGWIYSLYQAILLFVSIWALLESEKGHYTLLHKAWIKYCSLTWFIQQVCS